MKSKSTAASLAFLLGIFGVHRFYLGRRFQGILHLALFFFTFVVTIEEGAPFIMIPALLGFIDAVLLFVMPVEEFDERYNRRALRAWRRSRRRERAGRNDYRSETYPPRRSSHPQRRPYSHKRLGIELFRAQDLDGAADAFEKALDEDYQDPATHFNLACTYGLLQDADRTFFHLEKAVEFGFQNLEKIHRHNALSYVRTLPEFEDFVDNGYQLPLNGYATSGPDLEEPTLDLNGHKEPPKDDLLDQIVKLGDLRDKGILTEQEFVKQKKKLLG